MTRAARKLVACVVRTKACRSDQPGNVFFVVRRSRAESRHAIFASGFGGTSPSRRSARARKRDPLALLSATYGETVFPFGARQRRARGEMLERGRRDCRRHPFGARGAAAARRSERGGRRRLFVTDAFIKTGTSPIEILQALGLDGSYIEAVEKLYNPLQPRGTGRQRHPQRPLDEHSFIPPW